MKTKMLQLFGKWYKVAETGTSYPENTPDAVVCELEYARAAGYRIRLILGNAKTGKAWLEEHDVMGTVGRTRGQVQEALLISRRSALGGGSIMAGCVVGIKRAGKGGAWLYRHDKLHFPVLDSREVEDAALRAKGYTHEVFSEETGLDGIGRVEAKVEVQARFRSKERAENYIAFMRGERDRI